MDKEKVVVKLFEHFYNKVYKDNFKIDLDLNNQRQLVKNFVELLMKQYTYNTVGINFMIDVFAFGFSYYSDKLLKRKISLNWIIGKKLLKRFKERKDGTDYHTSNFLREYDINVDELRSSLIVQESEFDYLSLNKVEEATKGRMPDTEGRLYNCMRDTTMFNHRSPICITCHSKVTCKRILSELSPMVFKRRGYEK